jgi:hypothetical protein
MSAPKYFNWGRSFYTYRTVLCEWQSDTAVIDGLGVVEAVAVRPVTVVVRVAVCAATEAASSNIMAADRMADGILRVNGYQMSELIGL